MAVTPPNRIRFGVFELDPRSGELYKGTRKILLQEQPFQVLRMLVERAGNLVSREEIQHRLWPNDTIVEFDSSISTAIKKLRQALDDSAQNPKYIETVGRRGYRLMVPVERIEPAPEDGRDFDNSAAQLDSGAESGLAAGEPTKPLGPGAMTGRKVSHYRVLEVLGGGGMGVVYKAEDLKLGRPVALKFLPEELAHDPRALERFEREARSVSLLQHPNICPIYEFGEHESQPFIVMPLLEGQTLRERIAAKATLLSQDELLNLATQIATGLEAAHEKGIVHRDIKPANIFVTDRGETKILDFGLAKLTYTGDRDDVRNQEAQTIAATDPKVTKTGVAMGTAAYMSPEQIRGETLDARTDLFSFGLVLYEIATGRQAFTGETTPLLHDAILHCTPIPVRELNPGLQSKFAEIVNKALEKDREARYQSATEMMTDIRQSKSSSHQIAEHRSVLDRVLPTKRGRSVALAGGLLLLIIIATGYFSLTRRQSQHLSEGDTVVLADFANSTGEPVFDGTLNAALLVALRQSPFLNILSDDKVGGTLKAMNHPANATLTASVAREVCQRAGSRAYIAGAITSLNTHYGLQINAINCRSGEQLAYQQATAPTREKVLDTLGQTAAALRRDLGESSDSIRKFDIPLSEAITSSLAALKALSLGDAEHDSGDEFKALPYYQRAVELDPNFAMAYARLGAVYNNMGEAEQSEQNRQKAFELRDRAGENEKLYIMSHYYADSGQLEKGITALELYKQTYPRDSIPYNNLAAIYNNLGQFENALDNARLSVQLRSRQCQRL